MKKSILFLSASCLLSIANAQFEKGYQRFSLSVSPNIALSSNPSQSLSIQVMPAYELFLSEKISLLLYAQSEISYVKNLALNVKGRGFGFGTQSRYYFGEGKLKPFLVAGISYDINQYKSNYGDGTSTLVNSLINVYGGMGLNYSFNKYISLEVSATVKNSQGNRQEKSNDFN